MTLTFDMFRFAKVNGFTHPNSVSPKTYEEFRNQKGFILYESDLLITVIKTVTLSDIKIYRSSIRDYLENNNGRYNNPWIWDVKLNYRSGPSYIEKRAGMPKERWKWAFASIRASAEKYAKTSAVRAEHDVSVWFWSTGRIGALRKAGSTLADRKGPTGCAPHTDTDTPVGARVT